jgi:ABC-2 type transport system ATP-binding protein
MPGEIAVAPAPADQQTPPPVEFNPYESGAAPFKARSAAPAAIETTQLTKRYDSMVAVDHLDLRVEKGEIFGFLGPNGAGKTTTMRMLLGLIRPTSGSASILGLDVATDLPAILARTGSMIEEPAFYPYLSGRDNLRAMARLSRISEDLVAGVLQRVDLTSAADKHFKAYSMGMKQRLALGAALLADPEILILDEPANGLDPAGIVEMRDLMKELKHEGRTVLISSHVLHEVEQICDRIAIVNGGRIVVQGRVEELLHHNDKVEIRIDQPQEAADVLSTVPWIGHVDRSIDHILVSAPLERAAEINRLLADQGLYAAVIKPQEESLEQYFLEVTEGAKS